MTIKTDRRAVLAGLIMTTAAALPACQSSVKKFDAEVLILGAGLSGLHAARLLTSENKDVLVLEGSDRIGGRLHTLYHGDLGYTEGGGEQIGASYARIIDTARQLSVPLTLDEAPPRKTTYFYKDKLMGPEDWATSKIHPFSLPFQGASPGSPLFRLATKDNPLSNSEDWRHTNFAKYDISAEDYLTAKGFNTEAQRVIDIALNGTALKSYSMMNLYRSLQLYSQSRSMGPSLSISGGAQALPEAMAKSLQRGVKQNQIIKSINITDSAAEVQTAGGKTYRAPYCICTLPFGALRNIKLDAPISETQNQAIKHLPHTPIFQLHFKANTPFWKNDGLPVNMWTDSPLERIFANLDNTGRPTGLFRAWINGKAAQAWSQHTDVDNRAKNLFKTIRPESRGDIEILTMQNWTSTNPFSGGAYMHWAPGQILKWAKQMTKPVRRLVFAGEHMSYLHTGMEGAMESAENAAYSLLEM